MYYLLISLFLFTTTFIICYRSKEFQNPIVPEITCIFSGIVLFGLLLAIPISRTSTHTLILDYKVTNATLIESRQGGSSEIERAAVIHEIIEINKVVTIWKRDNKGQWDLWINDQVDQLELLK